MLHRTISYWTLAFLLILIFTSVVATRIVRRLRKSPAREAAEKHTETGRFLLSQKRYKDAFKEFEKAIALDGTYVPACESLVLTCLACSSMFEDALEVLHLAALAVPDNGDTHFNLGVLLSIKKSHEGAIKEYTRAIELGVKHADVYHYLGISCAQASKHKEAVENYKKALESDPDNPELHYNLGVVYEVINDAGNALTEYEIAARLDPNGVDKLFRVAFVCHGMGKDAKAIQNLKKVIRLDPNYRGARQMLGACYIDLNDVEKARRALFGEIARFPDDAHSHFLLGQIHSTQKQTDAAIKEFRMAIKLDENTHTLNEDTHLYHYALAQELFKQGKADEAKKVMRDSEELRKKQVDRKYKR